MKKMNKKGFTLAELLIVIAIIAILIAIAIPSFSASLYRAKLQADHANVRSAYAIYQTATLTDILDDGTEAGVKSSAMSTNKYYFQQDGSLKPGADTTAYKLQVKAEDGDCAASIGCTMSGNSHAKDNVIYITYDSSTKKWALNVKAS